MNLHNYMEAILQQFLLHLDSLKTELKAYPGEQVIWQTREGIANSAGNLALHLLGNLNHFIGAGLGNTGYVRNRPLEFSTEFESRDTIIADIDKCAEMLSSVLPALKDGELDAPYPLPFRDQELPSHHVLLHCLSHLTYHLGQINYHRRLI